MPAAPIFEIRCKLKHTIDTQSFLAAKSVFHHFFFEIFIHSSQMLAFSAASLPSPENGKVISGITLNEPTVFAGWPKLPARLGDRIIGTWLEGKNSMPISRFDKTFCYILKRGHHENTRRRNFNAFMHQST